MTEMLCDGFLSTLTLANVSQYFILLCDAERRYFLLTVANNWDIRAV